MLAVEDGEEFAKSFHSLLGVSIDEAWQDFVTQLRHNLREMQLAGNLLSLETAEGSVALSRTPQPGLQEGLHRRWRETLAYFCRVS